MVSIGHRHSLLLVRRRADHAISIPNTRFGEKLHWRDRFAVATYVRNQSSDMTKYVFYLNKYITSFKTEEPGSALPFCRHWAVSLRHVEGQRWTAGVRDDTRHTRDAQARHVVRTLRPRRSVVVAQSTHRLEATTDERLGQVVAPAEPLVAALGMNEAPYRCTPKRLQRLRQLACTSSPNHTSLELHSAERRAHQRLRQHQRWRPRAGAGAAS